MDELIIPLQLEDGKQIDCYVIAVFDVEEKNYIALLPEGQESEKPEVLLFRYISLEQSEDEIEIQNIDDLEEWECVAARLSELLDEGE